MAETTNVLICGVTGTGGSAGLGRRIALRMLHHQRYQVTILVRPGTENMPEKKREVDKLSMKGARVVECDIERDPARVREVLIGIDCVISCVSGSALLDGQRNLIDAAKALGKVRRFIPSEFGIDVSTVPQGLNAMFDMKREIREYLKTVGLDHTIIQVGMLPESWFESGYLGLVDWRNGKATVPGDGNFRVAVTAIDDIADAVQDILEHPRSKNTTVNMVGEVITWNKALDTIQRMSNRTIDRKELPAAEIKRRVQAKDPTGAMLDVLLTEKSLLRPNAQEFTTHRFINFEEWFGRVLAGQKA